MAPQTDRSHSHEETLNALRERATKDGGDAFIVKVLRRPNPGMPPSVVAMLSGASLQHICNPEIWVPQLSGGGKYLMQGYHVDEPTKPIGGFVAFSMDGIEPRDVDGSALTKPDWRGPAVLEYPPKPAPRDARDADGIYAQAPLGPGPTDNATRTTNGWIRSPGGGLVRPDYAGASAQPVDAWRRDAAMLEAERRKIEDERLLNARERHKDELDSLKKSHEADMRALKTEMLGAIQQQRPSGPDASATMMLEMVKQAAEDRRAADVQRAEDRRLALATQERSDARFSAMMEKMFDRPKEDPMTMLTKVVELVKSGDKGNSNEAQLKMMTSMAEMSSMQVGTAMDFVQAAADLQLGASGDKGNKWEKVADQVMKGIGALARGAAARQPPQFIAPQPPPTYEQQARQQPLPQGQQPQPQQPPKPPPEIPVIQQFEDAIRAKTPIDTVATALLQHFLDPSIQQALMAKDVEGDFEKLIYKRLGNWHLEDTRNAEYLKALFTEVEKRLIAANIIAADEPEEEGDDQDDGEPEETE